ncbi:MAG: F0F1 ATP synthase subunit B [Parvularculaceae bacterium]
MRIYIQDHNGDVEAHGPEDASHGELEGSVEHGDSHGDSGAFPPFDPSHFASQLFWLAIIFAGLYLFLSRTALPRIATVLEERKNKVADDLDQAAELKSQAEEALRAYDEALAAAHAKANAIAASTRDALGEEIRALQAETDEEIARKTAEAEQRIAEAKEAALTHIRDIAAETAAEIFSKLTGGAPPDGAAPAAVERALSVRN